MAISRISQQRIGASIWPGHRTPFSIPVNVNEYWRKWTGCSSRVVNSSSLTPCRPMIAPAGMLQPVLERIHLDSLGSFAFYRQQARQLGWEEVGIFDLTPQLVSHYTRVRQELAKRREALASKVSNEYMDRMIQGLGHWIDAGESGYLAWGILHFRKPV